MADFFRATMRDIIDIFAELGRRLATFGEDNASQEVMARAMAENCWFTEGDIRYAVEALRDEMLDSAKLSNWLSHYPSVPSCQSRRVAIIMAGNIPLVGFFDLLCVLASGNIPCVKPSSKDFVLEEYVEGLLCNIEPSLQIERYAEGENYDAVIATGGESANLYFRTAFEGVPCLLRGSRHSVAVLSGKESEEDIKALADDIMLYGGLGCRNVSLLFVPRGCEVALPVRPMCRAYHNNYLQCRALLTMRGEKFEDLGEVVLVRSEIAEFPRFLSQINLVEYDDIRDVEAWLSSHETALQCVVSTIKELHPRQVPFGEAQRPTLFDYADGCDTMQFLLSI